MYSLDKNQYYILFEWVYITISECDGDKKI